MDTIVIVIVIVMVHGVNGFLEFLLLCNMLLKCYLPKVRMIFLILRFIFMLIRCLYTNMLKIEDYALQTDPGIYRHHTVTSLI